MKKTMHASPASVTGGDVTKTAASRQKTWSPLPFRRHHASGEGAGGGGSSATRGLRYVHTAESALNSSGGLTTDDSRNTTLDSSALTIGDVSVTESTRSVDTHTSNGVSVQLGGEEDSVDGCTDTVKLTTELARIDKKKALTMSKIEAEQRLKEENVSDYLTLSSASEGTDAQHRIKTQFEKRNQKSTLSIAHLQQKLAHYEARKVALQAGAAPTGRRRQAKAVLRDVGHGLRGMVANVRGAAKDTIVVKPKELASSIFKNRAGSADDIREADVTGDVNVTTRSLAADDRKHSNTGMLLLPNAKLPSDDDSSSLTSGSATGALLLAASSSCPGSSVSHQLLANNQAGSEGLQGGDLAPLQLELERQHETLTLLWKNFDNFKSQQQAMLDKLRASLKLSQEGYEVLDSHLLELAEMRQSDLQNLNEDIQNMEERMEYRLEERMRDVHELLESCQNRIAKMERTQQQAQQNSVDMVENSSARTIFTKLLNVVLAILAVVLVLISTAVYVAGPCLRTRLRLVLTVGLGVVVLLLYYRRLEMEQLCHDVLSGISHHLLPASASSSLPTSSSSWFSR